MLLFQQVVWTVCCAGGRAGNRGTPPPFPPNPLRSTTRLPADQISARACLWPCLFFEICLKRICGFSCQRFGTNRLKLEGSLRGNQIKCIALQRYSTTPPSTPTPLQKHTTRECEEHCIFSPSDEAITTLILHFHYSYFMNSNRLITC